MCPGEWAASVEGAWQHGLPLPPSSEQGVGWGGRPSSRERWASARTRDSHSDICYPGVGTQRVWVAPSL